MRTEAPARRHEMGTGGAFVQAIAHVAPALGVVFSVGLLGGVVGVAAPVALLAGGAVMALVALCLAELVELRRTAGGLPGLIGATLGNRAGALSGWTAALYEPLVPALNLVLLGVVLEPVVDAELGLFVPWWVWVLAGSGFVLAAGLGGLRASLRVALCLAAFELIVVVALALTGIFDPGPGGRDVSGLDPLAAVGAEGFALAAVFAVFTFAGFESVAPLSEEARPEAGLRRAMLGALSVSLAVLLLGSWGVLVGWGTDDVAALAADPAPVLTLAERLWGGAWVLVLVALTSSVLAVSIAAQSASSRMLFAAARQGSLPKAFAALDEKGAPRNAVLAQGLLTPVVALVAGVLVGREDVLAVAALVIVLAALALFAAMAAGLAQAGRLTSERRLLRHVVLPAVTFALVGYVTYRSVVPLPSGPARWAPWFVGAWIVVGAVAVLARTRGRLVAAGTTALLLAVGVPAMTDDAAAAELVELTSPSRFVDVSRMQFYGPDHPGDLRAMVRLPDGYDPDRAYPVLYLLHGLGEGHTTWSARSDTRALGGLGGDILATAAGLDAIVVMPEGADGWWTDWWNEGARGDPRWERWFLDDLVPLVEHSYRIRSGRRWRAIAGFSMGGYAALHLAARRPQAFGTAVSMSGQIALRELPDVPATPAVDPKTENAFGPRDGWYRRGLDPVERVRDLRHTRLMTTVGDGIPEPDDPSSPDGLAAAAATERYVVQLNTAFAEAAQAAGVKVTRTVGQGTHDYHSQRRRLREAIDWGLFADVRTAPRRWEHTTVAQTGRVWGLRYSMTAPPEGVVRLRRRGDILVGEGSGRIRLCLAGRPARTLILPFSVEW